MEPDTAQYRFVRNRAHGSSTPDCVRGVDALADIAPHDPTEIRRVRDCTHPRVLSLDAHGHILDWISWQDAVCLYVRDAVVWTLGDPCLTVHGGYNRLRGAQSVLELHPIVAARGHARGHTVVPSP